MQFALISPKSQTTANSNLREGEILEETAFSIPETELLSAFLMQLVSSCNIWAFIGSNGGITAGRTNPDHALFPYYTQDKIFDTAGTTGSFTVIQTIDQDKVQNWIPFDQSPTLKKGISRNVSKSVSGTKISLLERNENLGLTFEVTWTSSEKFGILKQSKIINHSSVPKKIRILDGIRNIMPPGVDQQFQNEFSNLTDAYKKNELISPSIALYSLSSIPTDKAEPNECLNATTVWNTGLDVKTHLLSEKQITSFCSGNEIQTEPYTRGQRGCYLIEADFTLDAEEIKDWWIISDVEQSAADIVGLQKLLSGNEAMDFTLRASIEQSLHKLNSLVSQVDGFQATALHRIGWRHYSNALFNMMRGGTFPKGYQIPCADLSNHIKTCNSPVYNAHKKWLSKLPDFLELSKLKDLLKNQKDRDLKRIISDYLPLSFSRRHGDPSRPWNRFSIELQDNAGNEKFFYQGNWRDIFQNWEALLHSFPRYSDVIISRFLNATTVDGYNPYRLTKDGFEWEREEPDAPWSNIGYWGDHQIIYLLKLLEFSEKYEPKALVNSLNDNRYVFAHVPYQIAPFEETLKNARDTITYDNATSDCIDKRVKKLGSDGQLLHGLSGEIVYGTLIEKLLIPLLAKLSNFVPGAGIWMNTQKPEWNDANNALAGYGASIVTLGYMLRYVRFLNDLIHTSKEESFELHRETTLFYEAVSEVFKQDPQASVENPINRGKWVKNLSEAGTDFRQQYYSNGFSGDKTLISAVSLKSCLQLIEKTITATLRANKRKDNLYHSYNLLRFEKDGAVKIEYLNLMLEGQVSIISSGLLDLHNCQALLDALECSSLYREDQNSYLLYPDKELPDLLSKGVILESEWKKSRIIQQHLNDKKQNLVEMDLEGKVRFNPCFHNIGHLHAELDNLTIAEEEKSILSEIYEKTFNHHSFTGRSGTFFAYEGLGSIYWHMVSKLLLAVQQCVTKAHDSKADFSLQNNLENHYHKIQEGIGINKSPAQYGAFPTDPYSHTPAHMGAQQPGMTGQVKEDFISRMAELGVSVKDGCLTFNPIILGKDEFFKSEGELILYSTRHELKTLKIPSMSLAFTVCHTPVLYHMHENEETLMKIIGKTINTSRQRNHLTQEETAAIFSRNEDIQQIEVSFPAHIFN